MALYSSYYVVATAITMTVCDDSSPPLFRSLLRFLLVHFSKTIIDSTLINVPTLKLVWITFRVDEVDQKLDEIE